MAISSSGMLMDALRKQNLLSRDQLEQLPKLVRGRCSDARSFAKSLIKRGWLSVYQVNQLLAGKSDLSIGPYCVLDRLGQGGLSAVYKGKHRDHGNLVAIKIIKPEVFASPEGRQQFLQEVEAMARLDHPNIVQFCDADQWRDTYYFAMEYVEGTDLGKVVRLSGALPVPDACNYARQAAQGLQHAYERNLVHRDIKPVNLFLTQIADTKVTQIKILDWGLASIQQLKGGVAEAGPETVAGIIGTADYLAPEQARNPHLADIRSDIYSLGCTLYFLLTGQPPFPDGTLMQKILQHQQDEPLPVDLFRSDIPEAVSSIVSRMLAKNPEERFQTPASIALALASHARSAPTPTITPSSRGTLLPPKAGDTVTMDMDDSKKTG